MRTQNARNSFWREVAKEMARDRLRAFRGSNGSYTVSSYGVVTNIKVTDNGVEVRHEPNGKPSTLENELTNARFAFEGAQRVVARQFGKVDQTTFNGSYTTRH